MLRAKKSKTLPPPFPTVAPIIPFLLAFKTLPATGSHVVSSYLLTHVSETCFVGVWEEMAPGPHLESGKLEYVLMVCGSLWKGASLLPSL